MLSKINAKDDRLHILYSLKVGLLNKQYNRMKENIILMRDARESLDGKWGLAIGTFIIYSVIIGAAGSVRDIGSIISLLIGGPFALGAAVFSLNISRGREATLEQIFQGFQRFSTALGAYVLMVLFVALWTLLLIVPGIIAALSYSMTFYIIADDHSIKAEEALRKSKAMMDGNKLKLFYLCLRFFLLALLCVLTLGIGFFWLIPFIHITMAKFYDDVRYG
jgi:uncharacterized membrane protein